jgi:glucose/arabinose dehydrogenase
MSRRRSPLHLFLAACVLLSSLVVAPYAATATATAQDDVPAFELWYEPVAEGFAEPLAVVDAGDDSGRLFVVEKGGTIRIINDGSVVQTPFLDITDRVGSRAYEQGLLGLAFAPDYAESGLLYVNYTDLSGNTRISRFTVTDDPNVADPASEEVTLRQAQPYPNHNGGHLAFGPDNYLYIGLGDGGSGGDPQGNGQRLDTWLGKILRIEVDPEFVPEGQPYGIPDDNPYIDQEGALPEIWAHGLRNPWRFSFDRETGDLWIADVGQDQIEEINLAAGNPPGLNYGWNPTEGTQCYLVAGCDTSGFTLPAMEYTHDEGGCSVTGGYVYRGEEMPDLQGDYVFADFCSGFLWTGSSDDGATWTMSPPIETGLGISAFGEDAEGNLYFADLPGGGVYLLVPAL